MARALKAAKAKSSPITADEIPQTKR